MEVVLIKEQDIFQKQDYCVETRELNAWPCYTQHTAKTKGVSNELQ